MLTYRLTIHCLYLLNYNEIKMKVLMPDISIPKYITLCMLFLFSATLSAKDVSVRILDARTKKPVSNAEVKNKADIVTQTDINGIFVADNSQAEIVSVSAIGYLPIHVDLKEKENVKNSIYYLTPDYFAEKTQLLYETRDRKYVTGAVSSIKGGEVENVAGTNRLNSLSGRMAGLDVRQLNGLPGSEASSVRIRGIHTFGSMQNVTYLVDGHVAADIRMLDPYDIEEVSILKDAAATVLYGLKSSNGVILINTKKGKKGSLKVNFNTEMTMQTPLKLFKFLDSHQYATLYNEALLNDDPNATPLYSEEDIALYKSGKSPYSHPNVDWVDLFLKDQTLMQRYNLDISGGSETAKYYVAASYVHNGGIFNIDEGLNTYNTNSAVDVLNLHGNVDLSISKNLSVFVDIKAKKDKRNAQGYYSASFDQSILNQLYHMPNNAYQPITYNGMVAGSSTYPSNPYGLLNKSGYGIMETNYISSTVDFKYNLGDFVPGLSLFGNFGFQSYADIVTNRVKSFSYYSQNSSGNWIQTGTDSQFTLGGSYSTGYRFFDHMAGLNYARYFGKHYVDASFMVNRHQTNEFVGGGITDTYQGIKGKLAYRFADRYLVDLAFAREGSNRFPKADRFGFFPAASVGWIVSEENFLKDNEMVNFLKLRASIGTNGNTVSNYFDYLSAFGTGNTVYFGTTAVGMSTLTQTKLGSKGITWEENTKQNVGLDFSVFNNRLTGSIDVFNEDVKHIIIAGAVSSMFGADLYSPVGEMNNKGYEVQLVWNDRIDELSYNIGLNYGFTKNKILNQMEIDREYPWMYRTGNPYGSTFGYVFDRYFTEDDDLSTLPDQSLISAKYQAGDLKYKDLNNDGVINDKDIAKIGNTYPEINYGLSMGMQYKGFDLAILFQGVANVDTYLSGDGEWAFYNKTGNVTAQHLGRWQPGSGQNATYPRLTLTSTNNTATSSYWMKDASFLRLKNVEIGYTLPVTWTKRVKLSRARVFLSGNNLITWDSLDNKDPESYDNRYPNVRSFSLGANLSF